MGTQQFSKRQTQTLLEQTPLLFLLSADVLSTAPHTDPRFTPTERIAISLAHRKKSTNETSSHHQNRKPFRQMYLCGTRYSAARSHTQSTPSPFPLCPSQRHCLHPCILSTCAHQAAKEPYTQYLNCCQCVDRQDMERRFESEQSRRVE
jgi:hypothetical protein